MARNLPLKGRISLPAKRLSVRKIKEVLRLKFHVGPWAAADRSKLLNWPGHPSWQWGPPRNRATVLPMPDFADLHRQRHRQRQQHSHVTQQLLWEEYRQANPDGYRYSRFCELYQRWRRK